MNDISFSHRHSSNPPNKYNRKAAWDDDWALGMAHRTSILQLEDDIVLSAEEAYSRWPFLKRQCVYTVIHPGIPIPITFNKLEDARTFFAVELQANKQRRQKRLR